MRSKGQKYRSLGTKT